MKKWLIGCLMALAMVCLMGMTANAETKKIVHTCNKCQKNRFRSDSIHSDPYKFDA